MEPASLAGAQALQLGARHRLQYRGHPMRRPLASNEVPVLARALVRASDAANAALGLDRPAPEQAAGLAEVRSAPATLGA